MVKGNEELILKSLCHIEIIKKIVPENYKEFMSNYIVLDSVMFHLIQIGEIASKFSNDFKNNYNYIDYLNIKGLRNIVVHDYSGVIYNEIFDIVKEELPKLEADYKNILEKDYKIPNSFITRYTSFFVENRIFLQDDSIGG